MSPSVESSSEHISNEKGQVKVKVADHGEDVGLPNIQQMSRKQSMSSYFTIAAAAFGLISDGCEYIVNAPNLCS